MPNKRLQIHLQKKEETLCIVCSLLTRRNFIYLNIFKRKKLKCLFVSHPGLFLLFCFQAVCVFPSNCPVVTQLKTLFVLPKANFRQVGLKTTKHLTNNSQTELFKTEFKLGNKNTDTVNGHNILNLYSHQTKQSTFLLTAPSKAPLPTTILVWVINMTRDQSLA